MGNDVTVALKPDEYRVYDVSVEVQLCLKDEKNLLQTEPSLVYLHLDRMVNDKGEIISRILLNELNRMDYIKIFNNKLSKTAIIWPCQAAHSDDDLTPFGIKYVGTTPYITFQVLCNTFRLLNYSVFLGEFLKNETEKVTWIISDVVGKCEEILNNCLDGISKTKYQVFKLKPSVSGSEFIPEVKVAAAVISYRKLKMLNSHEESKEEISGNKSSFPVSSEEINDYLVNCAWY